MARFSEDVFDYQNYIKARPDIEPDSIVWKRILAAHDKNGGQYELALELGCGPAKQAPKLAKLFDETLHVDESARMVHAAAAHWQDVGTKTGAKPQFKVGSSSSNCLLSRATPLILWSPEMLPNISIRIQSGGLNYNGL